MLQSVVGQKVSERFPSQALISVTPDEETYDEEDAAFCLEMLLRIVLENRYADVVHTVTPSRVRALPSLLLCAETVCRASGRRCATTSATSAFTPTRAASWWSEPWWDSCGSPSACCDERTSAPR